MYALSEGHVTQVKIVKCGSLPRRGKNPFEKRLRGGKFHFGFQRRVFRYLRSGRVLLVQYVMRFSMIFPTRYVCRPQTIADQTSQTLSQMQDSLHFDKLWTTKYVCLKQVLCVVKPCACVDVHARAHAHHQSVYVCEWVFTGRQRSCVHMLGSPNEALGVRSQSDWRPLALACFCFCSHDVPIRLLVAAHGYTCQTSGTASHAGGRAHPRRPESALEQLFRGRPRPSPHALLVAPYLRYLCAGYFRRGCHSPTSCAYSGRGKQVFAQSGEEGGHRSRTRLQPPCHRAPVSAGELAGRPLRRQVLVMSVRRQQSAGVELVGVATE